MPILTACHVWRKWFSAEHWSNLSHGRPILSEVLKELRKNSLVEGRKSNVHVSATFAWAAGMKVKYIHLQPVNADYAKKTHRRISDEFRTGRSNVVR